MHQTRRAGCRFALLFAAAVAFGSSASAVAGLVEGDGKGKAADDCLVELSVQSNVGQSGSTFTCSDCDGNCDADATPEGACTFRVALCANQTGDSACKPVALKRALARVMGVKKVHTLPTLPQSDLSGGAACAAFADNFQVKLKGKRHDKPGKAVILLTGVSTGKGKARRTDKDKFVFVCKPKEATCKCPVVNVTPTTIPAVCGDGVVAGDEECDDGNTVDGDGCDSNCTKTRCGNGVKTGNEACDPPCGPGCPGGQVCTNSCTCETTTACACGTPEPTMLQFTSNIGSGTCGMMKDDGGTLLPNVCAGGGSKSGEPCNTTKDCPGGICSAGTFACGGLYFGGSGVSVPLPSVVPDLSTALSKVTGCANNCTLTLGPTTAADTGSNRTCTSAGCLFGPPLPVTNPPNASLSTCIINRIAGDAAGTSSCSTGETSALSVPLSSDIYLTGNLLAFRCCGRPKSGEFCNGITDTACAPGVCEDNSIARCSGGTKAGGTCLQDSECPGGTCAVPIRPCPVCNPGTGKCNGGPNEGLACTPADSASLGDAYPTTHDCPPPPEKFLGTLPISFRLTTGTATHVAVDLPNQTNVYCGFCRHPVTLAYAKGRCSGGANDGNPCLIDLECPSGSCSSTQGVPCSGCSGGVNDGVACGSDADCPGGTCPLPGNAACREICSGGTNAGAVCEVPTCGPGGTCPAGTCTGGPTPGVLCCTGGGRCLGGYTSCQQNTAGSFGQVSKTVEATGKGAGPGGDHLKHDATLVSVFCIPPTLRNEVDAAASLPGPGLVSLSGRAQLLTKP